MANTFAKAILQPSILALGASISLLSYHPELRICDYFLHLPFWVGFVRPMGLYWNGTFLKQINKGIFPSDMKVYREMYLVSKNAILYDIILNHMIFHSILTVTMISYLYICNRFLISGSKIDQRKGTTLQNKEENKSLWNVLCSSGLNLIRGRVVFATFSILSQCLISYASVAKLEKGSQQMGIPTSTKRLLLTKELLVQFGWYGFLLKEFHNGFWVEKKGEKDSEVLSKVKQQQI